VFIKERMMPQFHTTILSAGKTAAGIEVPAEVVAALGTSKKPAVRVIIGTYSYRSTIAVMGSKFMLPISNEHRQNAGLKAGDEIDVTLELDTEPRVLELPEDFAQALDGDAAAKEFYESLSYSKQQRFVLPVKDAKTPETRQRRMDKAINDLRERKV
jgi:hypothetical protein